MEDVPSKAAVAVNMKASVVNGVLEADEGGEAFVSVNINNLDPNWLTSIKKKVDVEPGIIKASSTSYLCTIHRVPHRFHQYDDKVYVPQIISIGPFHYDKRNDQLQAMEEHKWRYLRDILNQHKEVCLEQFLLSVKGLEQRARECYSEEIELDSNSFVEMMVLDGCFLVELFRREWYEEYQDDPIFELEWLKHALVIDLLKQENQIPFFVLQHLSDMMNVPHPCPAEGALFFFEYWDFFKRLLSNRRIDNSELNVHHLLHLLHTHLVLTENVYDRSTDAKISTIRCASQLQYSGIKFKKRDDKDEFLDIKFQNGVIEIPAFIVEHMTNPIFFNLASFEHSYRYCNKYITAYISFMGSLIHTSKDVEILCENGIIDNWLSSDDEVATLFNNLEGVLVTDESEFFLISTFNEINRYCGHRYPTLKAALKRDYFKDPWAITSFLAALFIILLTLEQAFFSTFPKYAYQD